MKKKIFSALLACALVLAIGVGSALAALQMELIPMLSEDLIPLLVDPNGAPEIPSDGTGDGSYSNDSPSTQFPVGYIRSISATDLEEGVLEKIATSEGLNVDEIKFITSADVSYRTYEPTDKMKQEAADEGLEYVAKLNTVTFPEDGHYLVEIDFPDELVGMSVSDIRLQLVETDEIVNNASVVKIASPAAFVEVYGILGDKADKVLKKMFIIFMGNAQQSFTMFVLKLLLGLLGACSISFVSYAGLGIAGLLGLSGGFAFRKFFRKNKDKK